MSLFKKKPKPVYDAQKDILEGVDAIGTIVDQDLRLIINNISELRVAVDRIIVDLGSLKLDQKVLENNQIEILETLKFLTEKLDHLEIKFASQREGEDLSHAADLTGLDGGPAQFGD